MDYLYMASEGPESKENLPGACSVTVLRCDDRHRASKHLVRTDAGWVTLGYGAGYKFTADEHPIVGLEDFAALIEEVRRDPRKFVVRGALNAEGRKPSTIRRLKHACPRNGDAPTLDEVARHWLMCDVDGFALLPGEDLAADPETPIRRAITDLLPVEFHGAACFWQLSSSAGIAVGLLKAHMTFWLREPASNPRIKGVLAQHARGLDLALYQAAQPHYVADPTIEGAPDPIPQRTGWVNRSGSAVTLPELVELAALAVEARAPGHFRVAENDGTPFGRAALHSACHKIANAPDREKHLTVFGQARGIGQLAAGGEIPRDAAWAALCDALAAILPLCDDKGAAERTLQEGFDRGLLEPRNAPERGQDAAALHGAGIGAAILASAAAKKANTAPLSAPHYRTHTGTLDVAETRLHDALDGFHARALVWGVLSEDDRLVTPGDVGAAIIGAGIGKTRAEIERLPGFIAAAKAQGSPHRVLWLVPEHKLGGQALADMRALGINAEVWRGRTEEGDAATCHNMSEVRDAVRYGDNVEAAVCGPADPAKGAQCPFRSTCRFQAQKQPVQAADVVIAAHQSLFFHTEIGAGFGVLVVDESFWEAGVSEVARVRIADFAREVDVQPVRDSEGQYHAADTDKLTAICRKVQAAFEAVPAGGFLTRDALASACVAVVDVNLPAFGIAFRRADDARGAIGFEARRRSHELRPGLTAEERSQALQAMAGNPEIPARMDLWRAIRDLLESDADATGRIEVTARHVVVRALRRVLPDLAQLPTLLLDATMPLDIVRQFFPRCEIIVEAQAAGPMRLVQVTGSFGKSALCANATKPSDDPENVRRAERVKVLVDFVRLHGAPSAGVVTHKGIAPGFAAAGFRVAHFGALIGSNALADVPALFVIGATNADAAAVRDLALALFGRPVPADAGHSETRGIALADGTVASVPCRAFANPAMEAVRAAITDAGAVQAVARARGVRRTVTVWLLGNVAHPHAAERVADWRDVAPGVVERMAARGCVFESAADAWGKYGAEVFTSEKAAEHALARVSQTPNPLNGISLNGLGVCEMVPVRYQHPGARQRWRMAHVRRDLVLGFAEWLGVPGVKVEHAVVEPTPHPLDAMIQLRGGDPARCRVLADLPDDLPDFKFEDIAMPHSAVWSEPLAADAWTVLAAMTPQPAGDGEFVIPNLPRTNLRRVAGWDAEEGGFCLGRSRKRVVPEMRPLPRMTLAWCGMVPEPMAALNAVFWPELAAA